MAFSDQQVLQWFLDNPNATDAQIATTAAAAGVSAEQLSRVTSVPVPQIEARVAAAAPAVQLPATPAPAVAPAASLAPVARQITEVVDMGGEDGFREVTRTVYEPAPGAPTVKYNDGTEFDSRLIKQLAMELTQQVGPLQGKVFDTKGESIGFDFSEAKKILGSDNVTAYDQVLLDAAAGLAKQGVTSLKDLQPQKITVMASGGEGPDYPEERTQIINRNTGQVVDATIGRTFTGKGNTSYSLVPDASGQIKLTTQGNSSMDTLGKFALTAGAMYAGTALPGILGAGGLGLGATTTGALTGAATGALNAAANEQNILTGALGGAVLGGVAGYSQGANTPAPQDSIYSLANGTPNLNYMGGGQGLMSTGSANLASMGGAQGLQILAGLPSETLAEALRTFGGVNPSALSSMGLGTGITYVTPSGIVTENGTIIGGDVISQLGANTGFNLPNWLNENVGVGIGDTLAQVDTGINSGLFSGVTPTAPPSTTTSTTPTTGLPPVTPGVIGNLVKAGVGLLGTGAVAKAVGGGTNTPMQAPTQGVPTNDANYYNQLQQYYNAYLPQTPRDVVTPLQQWYNSQSGA